MPKALNVSNVSDTARWIAACRAGESARPDALFRDPLASRLAGELGRDIALATDRTVRDGWPMVTRTKLIDDLIIASLDAGCDRVINLAAGLDTRPYRLKLPPTLEWIEADLPAVVDEKQRLLAGETAVCRLRQEKVDLLDRHATAAFLDLALAGASRALVLTEGLLLYLDEAVVRALSAQLLEHASIRWWIMDLVGPAIMKMMSTTMPAVFANAPLKFASPEGVTYFEKLGWRATDIHSLIHAAIRFRRVAPLWRLIGLFPQPNPRNPGNARWSAVVRFERATSDSSQ